MGDHSCGGVWGGGDGGLGELVEGCGVEDVPPVFYGVEPTTRRDDEQHCGQSGGPFEEKGVWKF